MKVEEWNFLEPKELLKFYSRETSVE